MASRKDDDMTTAVIERFHSRGQHLWKKRKESNSYRICLEHQYGGRFIVLEHRYGRRFIVLEHQYGSNDVMWKRSITSRVVRSLVWNVIRHFTPPPTGDKARETLLPPAELERRPSSDISVFAWKQRWDFSQFWKKINPRLHVAFFNRFCSWTRKRHSDWQQYHLIGACPNNGHSVRDDIFLKSLRFQPSTRKL